MIDTVQGRKFRKDTSAMELVPSATVLLPLLAIVFFAAAVQSCVGFGANLLSQPLVLLLEPDYVPGSVLLAFVALTVAVLLRERQAVSIPTIRLAIIGRLLGTAVAFVALLYISQRGLGFLVAFWVLGVVAVVAFGVSPARNVRNLLIGGFVSGFGGTTSGIGGPPVAILFQDARGPVIRGSMAALFLFGGAVSVAVLSLGGRFGAKELVGSLLMMPAVGAGFGVSRWLIPYVDRGATRPAILLLSTLAACALLLRLVL